MSTVTIYIKDLEGRRPRELTVGRTYYASMVDGYGIIVVEDTLMAIPEPGKTFGPFHDGRLMLIASKDGIDVQFGTPGKRVNANAEGLFLQPEIREDEGVVILTAAE